MRTGQCFVIKENGRREGYFFTGIEEIEEGKTILVMCKMQRKEEITMESFLKILEEDYKRMLNNNTIEEF